jgi:hypothetical protein
VPVVEVFTFSDAKPKPFDWTIEGTYEVVQHGSGEELARRGINFGAVLQVNTDAWEPLLAWPGGHALEV